MEKCGYIVNVETCNKAVMENILISGIQKKHQIEQRRKDKSERVRFNKDI